MAATILSATSNADLTVTVPSVPAGAVVVLLASFDSDSATPPTAASANLTWTLRKHQVLSGNGGAAIFTAVNSGSGLTNEVATITHTGSPNRTTGVVLTGADTSSLANVNGGTVGFSTAIDATQASTTADSWVFAAVCALGAPVTPSAGTTEIYDNQPGWHARNTDASSGGTVTVSGTQTQANGAWATLEVLAAAGAGTAFQSAFQSDAFQIYGGNLEAAPSYGLSETATASDAQALARSVPLGLTESLTVSEVVALARRAGIAASESVTPSEAVAMARLLGLTLTESVTATDAVALAVSAPAATYEVTETATASESVTLQLVAGKSLTETATPSDAVALSISVAGAASLAETVVCSEALAFAKSVALGLSESVTATDGLRGSFDPGAEPRVPPVVPQWWRRHAKGGRLWRW